MAFPVQLCWSLTDAQTRRRELKGLINACSYCKSKKGWIISGDEEENITIDGLKIDIIPAWKWLLSAEK